MQALDQQIAASLLGIAENSADSFLITDHKGTTVYVNRAFERDTGFTRDEVVGRNPRILKSGKHNPEFYRRMWETILSGNVFRETIVNRKKNGELYHAQQTITPVTDSAGCITHFGSIIRDITDSVRAKEELEQGIQSLAQSNRELEHFAYIASHDLRAPLRTISSFARLVQQRCIDKLDAESKELFGFIDIGIQQMNELIDGVLELARVDTKGGALEPVDLTALCQRAIMSLNATISEARAEVTHDNLPAVMGDRRQLVQLLQNLIGNAVKFRNEVPPVVHVSAEQWEDKWRLSVRDNGIGIEAKDVERIFGIFKRLHAQSEYPGCGIGLSICKKIVERHNGRIWVESQPGQGTVFYFTLPSVD
jgi:chemotaxis family two-component system sensor kinase Cph1